MPKVTDIQQISFTVTEILDLIMTKGPLPTNANLSTLSVWVQQNGWAERVKADKNFELVLKFQLTNGS